MLRPGPQPLWVHFGLVLMLAQAFVLAGLGFYSMTRIDAAYQEQARDKLEHLAGNRAAAYARLLAQDTPEAIDEQISRDAQVLGVRILIHDLEGEIIADSLQVRSIPLFQGEFAELARELPGSGTRFHQQGSWHAVATPIGPHQSTVGGLWILRDASALKGSLELIRWELAAAAVVALGMLGLLVFLTLNGLSRTISRVAYGASRFAAGDLALRIDAPPSRELKALTGALNTMAGELSHKIGQLSARRAEQEALLQSMRGGLIAVGGDRRIATINRTAQQMLGIDETSTRGRRFDQAIVSPSVIRLLADVFADKRSVTRQFQLESETPLTIRATASLLNAEQDSDPGVILLLTDITQIKRLESIRSDFAANVSHELRTPITNIRGYVETLLDLDPADDKNAERFLNIIAKNVERLGAIIDDMLTLTNVERLETDDTIATSDNTASSLVLAVRALVGKELARKNMRLITAVPDDAVLNVNERLAEQAVANLVINAIRYSPHGTQVRIELRPITLENEADGYAISVVDQGPGIAPEHLDRIFERFYRVDKARSREAGGTGLGLAIVKHIAIAHGGTAWVDSAVGVGSTFSVSFPAALGHNTNPNPRTAAPHHHRDEHQQPDPSAELPAPADTETGYEHTRDPSP